MVNHNQRSIEAIRKGKIGDQIARDLLKGTITRGRDGKKQGARGVCVYFALLTCGTTPDVLVNKGCKARPPELRCNQLAGFEDTRVICRGVIMMAGDDRTVEVSVSGNIDTALISQDASVIMPIGEVGAEVGR